MSQLYLSGGAFGQRNVQAAECQEADYVNITPDERLPQQENCDYSCWTQCSNDACPPCANYGLCSPIIMNLGNGGFELTGLDNLVFFDMNADGSRESTGWTAPGRFESFLCLDRNKNERIDDGGELFGNGTSLLLRAGKAPNGYEALAEFDSKALGGNGDGSIDYRDRVFKDLRIWIDRNHNGFSEPGELLTLTEAGVVQIGLRYTRSGLLTSMEMSLLSRGALGCGKVGTNVRCRSTTSFSFVETDDLARVKKRSSSVAPTNARASSTHRTGDAKRPNTWLAAHPRGITVIRSRS